MPPRAKGYSKPKDAKGTFKRLFTYLKPFHTMLAMAMVCVLLSSAGGVAGTYLLKPIFNTATSMFQTGSTDFTPLVRQVLLLAAVYALAALANYGSSRLMLGVHTQVLYQIRRDMFAHMEKLPLQYFDTHTHGEIMSRFTNDTDTLREFLGNSLLSVLTNLLTLSGILIMMLLMSWKMTLIILAALVLMAFASTKLGKASAKYFRGQQQAMAAANGYVEELFEGQREVKVFCRENMVKDRYAKLAADLRDNATRATTSSMVLMPIMGNTSYILFALTAMAGTGMIIQGRMDIGTLAAFLQYAKQVNGPVSQISMQANNIFNALAGAERIFELMDTRPEVDAGQYRLVHTGRHGWAWEKDGQQIPLKGDVRFENVTFSYDGKKTVLRNLSLFAKPGQKIAFVGSTGAGKTTITNLINRFYDVQEGAITYDGINVKDIAKEDLRKSLGMVLQDIHLFTGTVMDNIRYGRLNATDEECVEAAKRSNAHFFISHLPEGYDTVLTADGANLSQGQRQLIAIARAAVADPPVLILDEATSSIDTRTEAHIEKGMDELMEGRTVFVIAHRLSTVRNADAIMVLENGEIIERGSHEDLLRQKGRYYQLYTGMFELS